MSVGNSSRAQPEVLERRSTLAIRLTPDTITLIGAILTRLEALAAGCDNHWACLPNVRLEWDIAVREALDEPEGPRCEFEILDLPDEGTRESTI